MLSLVLWLRKDLALQNAHTESNPVIREAFNKQILLSGVVSPVLSVSKDTDAGGTDKLLE